MERPQADIDRWPPRTNDIDLDERRHILRRRKEGQRSNPADDDARPRNVTNSSLDKR